MRLPDDRLSARFLPLALSVVLAACGSSGEVASASGGRSAQGPSADYPVVIGEPFTIEGTTYTPSDTLNHDEVGYLAVEDGDGGTGVSAAHRTLPLPSYAEVTSLETGRTILVRVERRGPMDNAHIIALSSAARAQLGASADAPVRVRRVNPPEVERAVLRRGETVPERMETPMSLVSVLKRKLPHDAVAQLPASPAPAPTARIIAEVMPPASAPAVAVDNGYVVQAGAYSTEDRARAVATAIDGRVEKLRTLWRVRTGPFASRAQAEASLAKVTGKGYSGARIYRTE